MRKKAMRVVPTMRINGPMLATAVILLCASLSLSSPLGAAQLSDGIYTLEFQAGSIFAQEIEILDFRWDSHSETYNFDVKMTAYGSLNMRSNATILVQGFAYDGEFRFIIPRSFAPEYSAYYFSGKTTETNGRFKGDGRMFGRVMLCKEQEDLTEMHDFTFTLTRMSDKEKKRSQQAGGAYVAPEAGAPSAHP